MKRRLIGEIMDIACKAGKIILENGGEIYRVEDTMLYISKAFGMDQCECYATPTTIILSIIDKEGDAHSRMVRIHSRSVNLQKVEAINTLSREIMKASISIEDSKKKLLEIDAMPDYKLWITVLASALGTGAFTIIFGGDLSYFLYGLLMGASLRFIVLYLNKMKLGDFTSNLIGGSIAAIGGWLLTSFGFLSDWWIITLSTLMLLVPGLLFTNALRDIASGDLVSGISRGTEAFSIAAALAAGAATTLMILTR